MYITEPQDTQFFPFQAGSFSFRYSKYGEPVCYSFFTDIASFITDFIKHNFISLSEIYNHCLEDINLIFPNFFTNHHVPVTQLQLLLWFWLSHLQITLTKSLRCIHFLLSAVPVSLNLYNFVTGSLSTTWLSIRLTYWIFLMLRYVSFCFTVNLSFNLLLSLLLLCSD